jgi:hypothetical protein
MKTIAEPVSFARFCLLVLVEHLAFAIPALVLNLLFDLINPRAAFFVFTFFILACPLLGWIGWLDAKGSNWVNTAASMKAAGAFSGQLYGLLLGGFIGSHFFGTGSSLYWAIGFLGLGHLAGIWLGGRIANRYFASQADQWKK